MEEKQRKERNYRWTLTFTSLAALVLLIVSLYQYNNYVTYKRQVEAGYERSFTELADCVNNIDLTLTKLMVTNNDNQVAGLSADLWREAAFAKANLGQLPLANSQLDNTANFLSQVGDYTYSLSKKITDGQQPSEKEIQQLQSLLEYSGSLNEELKSMEQMVMDGSLTFTDNGKKAGKAFAAETGSFSDSIGEVEKKFSDYVSLIYDGPFSQHIMDKKPKMTEGKKEISKEEAKKIATDFLPSEGVKSVEILSETDGLMPAYECRAIYENDDARETTVEVTKNGGFVRMLIDNRNVQEQKISEPEAEKLASKFLSDKGFNSMKQTGYITAGNCLDFAFAYEKDGYTIYTDLIKVKVALDNGEIVGFESNGYLTNHSDAITLPANSKSEEEARGEVKKELEIVNVNKCQIPLETGNQVFCYEFQVQYNKKQFLVYINMENLREEKILMVVDSNGSKMTI